MHVIGYRRLRSTLFGLSLLLMAAPTTFAVGATPAAAAVSGFGPYDCKPLHLDPDDFPSSPRIDNRFYPLVPGTRFVVQGSVLEDDGVLHPHRIETTVMPLTKVIDRVNTMVVLDVDIEDGVLQESELFFVAQDVHGAIWTFGEYPEEYDQGTLVGADSTWLDGVRGARAGTAMLAHPRAGGAPYLQGLSKQIEFKDCARVFQTGQRTCTPLHCYDNVLVVDEYAPNDPDGGHQRKYYAPNIGNVKVTPVGGQQAEKLEVTSIRHLCAAQLAPYLRYAIDQDTRGYDVAGAIYGKAPPAKHTLRLGPC